MEQVNDQLWPDNYLTSSDIINIPQVVREQVLEQLW